MPRLPRALRGGARGALAGSREPAEASGDPHGGGRAQGPAGGLRAGACASASGPRRPELRREAGAEAEEEGGGGSRTAPGGPRTSQEPIRGGDVRFGRAIAGGDPPEPPPVRG